MSTTETTANEELQRLISAPQEPGVAQAIASYKAIESIYAEAAAVVMPRYGATSQASNTIGR